MAWPADGIALDQGVEMYIDGVWTDITPFVYSRDGVSISHGRSNEGSFSEPSRMSLTLNNRDGRFSPRNPNGAYFGKIGRNTKIRHWVRNGSPRLVLQGGDQFFTPDSVPISVTGDIDLRVDIDLPTWRPGSTPIVGAIKGGSYYLYLTNSGYLSIAWVAAGVTKFLSATEPVPAGTVGRKSLRAFLDVNNGAGGHTATFYYSSDYTMDGTWIQMGSSVTGSGVTSIDNTTQNLGVYSGSYAEVHEARVYSGVTKVASPKFTSQAVGTTAFNDAEGNLWSAYSTASIDNKHYRFFGDVTSWRVQSDRSGSDVYTSIECSGLTGRLGQGAAPVSSALRRGIPAIGSSLRGYWPFPCHQY